MISSTAKPNRIVDAVTKAHQNGLARGGDIAEAAKNRLESPLQTIETAHAMLQAAAKAASAAWVLVLAADNNADNVIGAVRDEMYNALGRPRQSPAMDEVFPGGMGTYTNGDPRNQPVQVGTYLVWGAKIRREVMDRGGGTANVCGEGLIWDADRSKKPARGVTAEFAAVDLWARGVAADVGLRKQRARGGRGGI